MINLNTRVSAITDAPTIKAVKAPTGKHLLRRAIQTAVASSLLTGAMIAPMLAQACDVDSAKPFNSGPFDPAGLQKGFFPEYIVDSNGVALQVCTVGNGVTPCFFDPKITGNALSQLLGRGNEAFYFLADSNGTTTGAFPITWVMVMGVESAFLSPVPTDGFQTQFQRLRTRVNVDAVGIYTVETPWSKKSYTVIELLKPGSGQNRMEISDPIDIPFSPNSSVAGLVSPFLIAVDKTGLAAGLNPADFIGDGITPTKVTGSPCGTNYVKITAVGLDGVTPIDINNGSNVIINDLFTVMGKVAPSAKVPLSIDAAYYSRRGAQDTVTLMAQGSTSATQEATMQAVVGGSAITLQKDFNRFFGTQSVPLTLPATVSVTAIDTGKPSSPNTLSVSLKDLVTIDIASATCTGVGATKSCALTVKAASSDESTGVTLTLEHPEAFLPSCMNITPNVCTPTTATTLKAGVSTTVYTKAGLPAAVTVISNKGGVAVKPVTIIN